MGRLIFRFSLQRRLVTARTIVQLLYYNAMKFTCPNYRIAAAFTQAQHWKDAYICLFLCYNNKNLSSKFNLPDKAPIIAHG